MNMQTTETICGTRPADYAIFEAFALLGHHAVMVDSCLPTHRDGISVKG